MILRRLTNHIKEQNWFAVALDFSIVVFGVFVGLQVQRWAQELDQQQSEAIYLQRLHGEVEQAAELRAGNASHRYLTMQGLNSAYATLFNLNSATTLSQQACDAIAIAHVMSQITTNLPTLTGLLSSGRLDTLTSATTRASLIGFVQQRNREADALVAINRSVQPLARQHSELLELQGVVDVESTRDLFNAQCDSEKMTSNRAFLNDFIDIRARYAGYISTIDRDSAALDRLHAALDAELGLDHTEVATP